MLKQIRTDRHCGNYVELTAQAWQKIGKNMSKPEAELWNLFVLGQSVI